MTRLEKALLVMAGQIIPRKHSSEVGEGCICSILLDLGAFIDRPVRVRQQGSVQMSGDVKGLYAR